MKEKVEVLLKLWGIESEVKQIYQTAWAVGEEYVLKIGEDFKAFTRNITIMKALNACDIPVAFPILTIDGREYVLRYEKYRITICSILLK